MTLKVKGFILEYLENTKSLHIYITDNDDRTNDDVMEVVNYLDTVAGEPIDTISIKINSTGGNWFIYYPIYNSLLAIIEYDKPTVNIFNTYVANSFMGKICTLVKHGNEHSQLYVYSISSIMIHAHWDKLETRGPNITKDLQNRYMYDFTRNSTGIKNFFKLTEEESIDYDKGLDIWLPAEELVSRGVASYVC
jgi:ATP-dependent protease ClpP protease subunit